MTPAWRKAWLARLARVGGGRRFPPRTERNLEAYVEQFCRLNGLRHTRQERKPS